MINLTWDGPISTDNCWLVFLGVLGGVSTCSGCPRERQGCPASLEVQGEHRRLGCPASSVEGVPQHGSAFPLNCRAQGVCHPGWQRSARAGCMFCRPLSHARGEGAGQSAESTPGRTVDHLESSSGRISWNSSNGSMIHYQGICMLRYSISCHWMRRSLGWGQWNRQRSFTA